MSSLFPVYFIFVFVSLSRESVLSLKYSAQDSFDKIHPVKQTRVKRGADIAVDTYAIQTKLTNGFHDMEQRFLNIDDTLNAKMDKIETMLQEFRDSLMAEIAHNKKEIKNEVHNIENNLKSHIQDLNDRTNDILLQLNGKMQNSSNLQDTLQTTLEDNNIKLKTYMEGSIKNQIQDVENNLKTQINLLTNATKDVLLKIQNSSSVQEAFRSTIEDSLSNNNLKIQKQITDEISHFENNLKINFQGVNNQTNNILSQIKGQIQNSSRLQETYRTTLEKKLLSNNLEIKKLMDGSYQNERQNVEKSLKLHIAGLNNRTDSILSQLNSKIEHANSLFETFRTAIYFNLPSNILQIKTNVRSSVIPVKDEFQRMEANLKLHITGLKQQIDSSVQNASRPTIGRSVSLLEENKNRDDQDGGCGGIVVGDRGYILYRPENSNKTAFRCIWTVRANLHEKVVLKLINGDVGSNTNVTLSIMPLKTMLKSSVLNELQNSSQIMLNKRVEYWVDGPVVFVTLICKFSSPLTPHFRLYYEGRGGNTVPKQYRHYHHTESEGEVDYPKIRGVTQYSPNEVVTFVIAPHSEFNLKLKYVDLEPESYCEHDSLTVYQPQLTFYAPIADEEIAKSFRYCSRNTTLIKQSHGIIPQNAFILTFKSCPSTEFSGFQFSWP